MKIPKYAIGFDIGGTKCATILAKIESESVVFLSRIEFATQGTWDNILNVMCSNSLSQLEENNIKKDWVVGVGISCGGPLDSKRGLILSPPNLPNWDNVPVVNFVQQKLGLVAKLKNDADAGAIAEHMFGAGKGYQNILFLTFGTGLGCGMVLNGQIYSGTTDSAGEVGHIRLDNFGPVGFGKAGSFEGFCSGGGIKQLGKIYATEKLQCGQEVSYCKSLQEIDDFSAKDVANCAKKGEEDAIEVFKLCGQYFGKGLAVLVDILNPELIIAGGVYMRSHELIYPYAIEVLKKEALSINLNACKIIPSMLGEKIGDYAAIAIAMSK